MNLGPDRGIEAAPFEGVFCETKPPSALLSVQIMVHSHKNEPSERLAARRDASRSHFLRWPIGARDKREYCAQNTLPILPTIVINRIQASFRERNTRRQPRVARPDPGKAPYRGNAPSNRPGSPGLAHGRLAAVRSILSG